MDFFTLAKNRYSVRKFSERSVEPEKLEKVLEAARVAPTAHNYQPFRIYVLKSKDAIAKIRELTPCAFNAPIVLMVTICRDEQWVNELEKGFLSGQVDAGIIGNKDWEAAGWLTFRPLRPPTPLACPIMKCLFFSFPWAMPQMG